MEYIANPYLFELIEKHVKFFGRSFFTSLVVILIYTPLLYKSSAGSILFFGGIEVFFILLLISINYGVTLSRSKKLNRVVTNIFINGPEITLITAPVKTLIWINLPAIKHTIKKKHFYKSSEYELKQQMQVSGMVLMFDFLTEQIYVITDYFEEDIVDKLNP